MKKLLFFGLILSLGLISCNSTFQYNVHVKNSTGEDLEVSFKTDQDIEGAKETKISLKNGEGKQIISTKEIDLGDNSNRTSAKHCKFVAEYVKAIASNGVESKVNWCEESESIKFAVVDIGQGEFYIEYTKEDF